VQFRVATILVQNRSLAFFRPLDRERHSRSLEHPGMSGDPRGRKDYHGELLFGKELWSSANRHLGAVNRERGYLVEIHRFRSPNAAVPRCEPGPSTGPRTPTPGAGPSSHPFGLKIFVSTQGGYYLFPKPFSGNTDRAYSQFSAALRTAGYFELASDPSEVDLVLELQLLAPTGPTNADKQKGASETVLEFCLTIYDRKSHYILWTLSESIGVALLQKTHDRNLDDALPKATA
jgi:hypothetical protein